MRKSERRRERRKRRVKAAALIILKERERGGNIVWKCLERERGLAERWRGTAEGKTTILRQEEESGKKK